MVRNKGNSIVLTRDGGLLDDSFFKVGFDHLKRLEWAVCHVARPFLSFARFDETPAVVSAKRNLNKSKLVSTECFSVFLKADGCYCALAKEFCGKELLPFDERRIDDVSKFLED